MDHLRMFFSCVGGFSQVNGVFRFKIVLRLFARSAQNGSFTCGQVPAEVNLRKRFIRPIISSLRRKVKEKS